MLLEIESLDVRFAMGGNREAQAVHDVSLRIRAGDSLAIVGESGSGKTTIARAVLRLLPANARVSGSIRFRSTDLLKSPAAELRRLRGEKIALIQQSADRALDPVRCVREQVAEVIRSHRPWSTRRCRDEAECVLHRVFETGADRIGDAYPHQLSGGQRQRVVFAQAVACSPEVLIADEPTASLDTITQAEVLGMLRRWNEQPETALLFITHDPGVAAATSRYVAVTYAGEIVETGPTAEVLRTPAHPYTRALLRCRPSPGRPMEPWPVIPGLPHDAARPQAGCRFLPRCDESGAGCGEPQKLTLLAGERKVRCIRAAHG